LDRAQLVALYHLGIQASDSGFLTEVDALRKKGATQEISRPLLTHLRNARVALKSERQRDAFREALGRVLKPKPRKAVAAKPVRRAAR
jgi:hypothetical protein